MRFRKRNATKRPAVAICIARVPMPRSGLSVSGDMLRRQYTTGFVGQFLQRALPRDACPIGEFPRGVTLYLLVQANLHLSLPARERTFDIWQKFRRATKHTLGCLAVWTPERTIEYDTPIRETGRECVELA